MASTKADRTRSATARSWASPCASSDSCLRRTGSGSPRRGGVNQRRGAARVPDRNTEMADEGRGCGN
eukprot:1876783-Lingulodinium_polyedra.AAC.1